MIEQLKEAHIVVAILILLAAGITLSALVGFVIALITSLIDLWKEKRRPRIPVTQEMIDSQHSTLREIYGKGVMEQFGKNNCLIPVDDSKKLRPIQWPVIGEMPETVKCPTCNTTCHKERG